MAEHSKLCATCGERPDGAENSIYCHRCLRAWRWEVLVTDCCEHPPNRRDPRNLESVQDALLEASHGA